MSEEKREIYVLAGVTAAGKSDFAIKWAEENDAEILSCDSVAIYRGMDLGSAKPDMEIRSRVPHYGIDLCEVSDRWDVSRYVNYAKAQVDDILERKRTVLVVGGSGFYLRSFFSPVVDQVVVPSAVRQEVEATYDNYGLERLIQRLSELNPEGLGDLDQLNPRRVMRALERCIASGKSILHLKSEFAAQSFPFDHLSKQVIWVDRENSDLELRISLRTEKMLAAGLVEETEKLMENGILENAAAFNAIGYRETIAFLQGKLERSLLMDSINLATRKLVAKQRKWFRKHLPGESRRCIAQSNGGGVDEFMWCRWS